MVAQHLNRAGMQIACPRIIAKPGPHPQNIVERSAAERADVGPARQKSLEIGSDGLDAGLLQHDFRQPHAIGIGAFAGWRPPRQFSAMAVVPCKQQRGAVGSRRLL
jgi:hypothetical protein